MKEIGDSNGTRRTVLKAITGGSAALIGVTGSATATGSRFGGLAYDTLTQQTAGPVSGNVKSSNGELNGSIKIAGYKLSLSEVEKKNSSGRFEYAGTFDDEEYLEEYSDKKYPLKLNLTRLTNPERFAGTLNRPSSKWGEIGFYLIPQKHFKYEPAVKAQSPRPKWEEHELTFTIPDEGLPTDTGSKRFVEDLEPVQPGRDVVSSEQETKSSQTDNEVRLLSHQYVDTGVLGEKVWYGSEDDRDCSYQEPSWTLASGVTGRGTEKEEFYQIESGESAIWEFHTHFTQRPDGHLISEYCDADPSPPYGRPISYQFHIEIGEHEVVDDLYFTDPEPDDDDSESNNGLLGFGFEFVNAIYGNVYTRMGTALYNLSQGGDRAEVERLNQGAEMQYNIPLGQSHDNLPTEDDEQVASVRLRVNNDYDSGEHSVVVHPSFGFTLPGTPSAGSSCYCNYNSPVGFNSAPSRPLEVEYKAISG